jgi:porphobilinogen deaminase
VPVAAFAESALRSQVPGIRLWGLVASLDGKKVIRVQGEGADAGQLGEDLAQQAAAQGADEILIATGVK